MISWFALNIVIGYSLIVSEYIFNEKPLVFVETREGIKYRSIIFKTRSILPNIIL